MKFYIDLKAKLEPQLPEGWKITQDPLRGQGWQSLVLKTDLFYPPTATTVAERIYIAVDTRGTTKGQVRLNDEGLTYEWLAYRGLSAGFVRNRRRWKKTLFPELDIEYTYNKDQDEHQLFVYSSQDEIIEKTIHLAESCRRMIVEVRSLGEEEAVNRAVESFFLEAQIA